MLNLCILVFQVMKQVTLQHKGTLDTELVSWGYTKFTAMPFTGDVVLCGKTSNADPPMSHVYKCSATSWKKERSIPALCQHEGDTNLLRVIINIQDYLAISCYYCKKIRLYNMTTGEITTAFNDPNYYPGHMCHGDTGQIYVVHNEKGSVSIQQLDCSRPQFRLIKTIQSGMVDYFAICYINRHGLLTVSDYSPGVVRAVSCETENVVWELTGRVDGVECEPQGMLYSPHHNALLIADGNNCRILCEIVIVIK